MKVKILTKISESNYEKLCSESARHPASITRMASIIVEEFIKKTLEDENINLLHQRKWTGEKEIKLVTAILEEDEFKQFMKIVQKRKTTKSLLMRAILDVYFINNPTEKPEDESESKSEAEIEDEKAEIMQKIDSGEFEQTKENFWRDPETGIEYLKNGDKPLF